MTILLGLVPASPAISCMRCHHPIPWQTQSTRDVGESLGTATSHWWGTGPGSSPQAGVGAEGDTGKGWMRGGRDEPVCSS